MSKKDKLGRNNPCPCGSGRKFKKCHLNREFEPKINFFEMGRRLKTQHNALYCLHPNNSECSGDIIRAHTIQRNGGLACIAVDGHVMGVDSSSDAVAKNKGKASVRKIGVKQASTITGFCGYHDGTVFKPIEDVPFQSTQEQCFLLGYRALCRELFIKQAGVDKMPLMRDFDKGRKIALQILFQNFLNQSEYGGKKGLRNLEYEKKIWDNSLLSRDFDNVQHYVILIDSTPEIMTSFGIFPEVDFAGKRLQNLSEEFDQFDFISFSLIATETGGAIVFCFLKDESKSCFEFIKSLEAINDDELGNRIVSFVFEYSDNVFFSNTWWEALPIPQQTALLNRINSGNAINPRGTSCLKPDGQKYVGWKILERKTNIALH